jgi:hypothetical protein
VNDQPHLWSVKNIIILVFRVENALLSAKFG